MRRVRSCRFRFSKRGLITIDSMILGGIPTFRGTRVPVDSVSASLKKGISRERVLSAYPSLTHEHLDAAVKNDWASIHR